MKYTKKYASFADETIQRNRFIRSNRELRYIMCGVPKQAVDICSEGRFCSEARCERFYKEASEEFSGDPP